MEVSELEANLALYRAQLQQLDELPGYSNAASDANERSKEMQALREELQELINLTEEALLNSKKNELLAYLQTTTSNFGATSSVAESALSHSHNSIVSNIEESICSNSIAGSAQVETGDAFAELLGTQCSAVFRLSNGTARRLNAVIFDVDYSSTSCSVFCCTPTEPKLVPCRFFLADRCAFDSKSCRYSHGYIVSLDDLAEYVEPDFTTLRSGLRCLARRASPAAASTESISNGMISDIGSDDGSDNTLWLEGTIERVDFIALNCFIRFSSGVCGTTPFASVFPLVEYVVELSDSDDSPSSDEDVVEVGCSKKEPVRRKRRRNSTIIEISDDDEDEVRLLGVTHTSTNDAKKPVELESTGGNSSGFGSWERYTKGFGSKLLRKMGYVEGGGLGTGGSGRVEPVPIEVLPNGRSLDEIMRLKVAANDRHLFNVSATFGCDAADGARLDSALRRIRKLNFGPQKPGHHLQKPRKPRPESDHENSVFAFINRRIQGEQTGQKTAEQKLGVPSTSEKQLRGRSDRELNVEAFQMERRLRDLDVQIARQEATVQRFGIVSTSGAHLTQTRDKLNRLKLQREELRTAMRRLDSHRDARRQNAKFSSF